MTTTEEEKKYKVTRIFGVQARAIIDVLEKDGALSFTENSIGDMPILEVYSNKEPNAYLEYWD